ncbi:MAG: isochorismate synthase [Myxococcaceae bacterium]|nr:isochorismate synthase [Myxococcaceae bacterium]
MLQALQRQRFVAVSRVSDEGALLRLSGAPLSVVWVNPSRGISMVGLGVCAEGGGEVSLPVELPAGPWFGGWGFDARRPWPDFDHERWVLPEVLAWWNGRQTVLLAFGAEGASTVELERRLDAVEEVEPIVTRAPVRRLGDGRAAYERLVGQALARLGPEVSKLVVARAIELESDAPFPERAVLKALEARNPSCWTFLVRGRDGAAFVGSSPELLCEARGRRYCTDALAGTAPADEGERLLASEKDQREHQAVVDELRARLDGFVTRLEVPPAPALKRLSQVAHLHTPITAQLREGVTALEVARALHPTPAVAGSPPARAQEWLGSHEDFVRGWYTGAVGAVGPDSVTLAVALRSAVLRGARATAFVGAGVVRGSTPESEWLETERKARTMLGALGVEDV